MIDVTKAKGSAYAETYHRFSFRLLGTINNGYQAGIMMLVNSSAARQRSHNGNKSID